MSRVEPVTSFASPALQITGLRKSFDDTQAVDGLSLTIPRGMFYALLGPNGAGKTTTLRMVAGLAHQDDGAITVCGHDTATAGIEAKRVTAWVPDEPLIYDRLTPREYLAFVAGLWNVEPEVAAARADELLDVLGLDPHAEKRCQGLSKGMRQKVALAGALIHDPELIILDEPLTGLDAASARQVKKVLRARVERGVTIIMTTHILEVAERLADRIGIISAGKLVAEGTLTELRSGVAGSGAQDGQPDQALEDIFLALVAAADDAQIAPAAELEAAA